MQRERTTIRPGKLTPRAVLVTAAFLTVVLLAAVLYWRWTQDAPRRESLAALTQLDTALHSGDRAELLHLVVMPTAIQGRTAPEQSEFLAKALNDEISPEGLAVLRKHGRYGPLKELFPAEAETWAKRAGVNPDDCVAFKLERAGLCAEVVLYKPANPESPCLIVRLNNVKQLAEARLLAPQNKS